MTDADQLRDTKCTPCADAPQSAQESSEAAAPP
jgi:hypothetical protein